MYVVLCALKYEFMQPDMYTLNGTVRENLLIYLVCMYIYICIYSIVVYKLVFLVSRSDSRNRSFLYYLPFAGRMQ